MQLPPETLVRHVADRRQR